MGNIPAQSGHAVQRILPRLRGQDFNALSNQDRRFAFNLDAVLQILNSLDAADQGLTTRRQRLTRECRASFGRFALPSLGLQYVKRGLHQQLLRFIDPHSVHVIGGRCLVGGGVGGIHKRSNRTVEDGRTQAKVGIVAAQTRLGRGQACFFSDTFLSFGFFFRVFHPKERTFDLSLFTILSPTGNTEAIFKTPLLVNINNPPVQQNNFLVNTKNLKFLFLTSLKKFKNCDF
jgi:hypothetical protein